MGDDTKKAILARRARFVAAALAGLSTDACGKDDAKLKDPDAQVTPMPCLSVAVPQPPPEPTPQPCLSAVPPGPPPPPRPCLSVAPTPHDAGYDADCATPFTIDAQGVKHYKAKCLM